MKTLDDLSELMMSLPCRIAQCNPKSTTDVSDLSQKTNLRDGFPEDYGKDSSSADNHILLKDFNGFAALVSDEKNFKDIGGVHTFNSDVAVGTDGYPCGGVLVYSDGVYDKLVESTVQKNTVDFVAHPEAIDKYYSPNESTSPEIYWISRNKVYGVEEDVFRIGADFDKGHSIEQGEALGEDSLVVVGNSAATYSLCDWMNWVLMDDSKRRHGAVKFSLCLTNQDGTSTPEFFPVTNRGTQGGTGVFFSVPVGQQTFTLAFFGLMEGNENYSMAFFVKKGSSVNLNYIATTQFSDVTGVPSSGKGTTLIAFPLKARVSLPTEGV